MRLSTGVLDIERVNMRLQRKRGFYEKYVKRILDIICASLAIVGFSWLYLAIAVIVRIKMGKPVIFKQPRPGMIDPKTGEERIFDMYKFRTMTDERDENGKPLKAYGSATLVVDHISENSQNGQETE